MNRTELIKQARDLVREHHPNIKKIKVTPLRDPPERWYQYHGRNAIKFVNRWSVKTYPTGLKKKQIYLLISGDGFHPTIYDATLENGRIWLSSMGRFQ